MININPGGVVDHRALAYAGHTACLICMEMKAWRRISTGCDYIGSNMSEPPSLYF